MMQSNRRANDLVARFGGEEFMILLPYCDSQHSHQLAEKLRRDVKALQITLPNAKPLSFSISIGVAEYDNSITNIDDLISHADHALYQAKNSGRDQVQVYKKLATA